ncbi:MAG TPA: hypothetical protein VEA38_11145 [Terriglobales bacterium]|nr:hypothetical protein [Terriglobales bacterium]
MRKLVVVGLFVAASVGPSAVAEGQVSVNVNIGPPPVIFASPPRVVVVPRTPVYYAPDTSYNVFVYQDRYYAFHDGAWFLANTHRGPWVAVAHPHVPQPLLAVPVRYYKVPPGHAKHGHWKAEHHHGRHDKHHDKHDKHHGKHRGHGHGKHKDKD